MAVAILVLTFTLISLLTTRIWCTYLARRRTIKKHGCKPIPSVTGGGPTIFDLDLAYLLRGASKTGLEKLPVSKQFQILGPTFRGQVFTKPVIRTCDPRVVQAVFASDADSFGNRPLRQFSFSPLCGRGGGVMTLDGAAHANARAMLRPTFSRPNVETEEAFNAHVARLLERVPVDGSTVNLQELFRRLNLDSSTELIFGESVGSLTPDTHRFLAAFERAQSGMGARFRMLPFNFLHRDRGFWVACDEVRRFVARCVDNAVARRSGGKEEGRGAKSYILADNLVMESRDRSLVEDSLMNVFLPG